MLSKESYEANIYQRLEELRKGDPAYELHTDAIADAIVFAWDHMQSENDPMRLLDVGCGLGFLTKHFNKIWPTVGIDVSDLSIKLAKEEHPDVTFFTADPESFSLQMVESNIPLFHQAILNMVLHSVDDSTIAKILNGVRKCLVPDGVVIVVVPTEAWLQTKLIEYARDQVKMPKAEGLKWIDDQLRKPEIELAVKTREGEFYPYKLKIYNRTLQNYGRIFVANRFGIDLESYGEDVYVQQNLVNGVMPFWQMNDLVFHYSPALDLGRRDHEVLLIKSLD